MATTFTWKVHQLEIQLGVPHSIIVHWSCDGVLNGVRGKSYGTFSVPDVEGAPAADSLTEETTLAFCWANGLDKNATETIVQSEIDYQRNVSLGLTWDTSLTHDQYRQRAYAKVDAFHADFMNKLTGSATIEERDTWVVKSEAAKYVASVSDETLVSDVALVVANDPAANDDLESLINDVGVEVADLRSLSLTILAKSRAYKKLIGIASRVRREARSAIDVATAPEVPIENVGAALDQVEEALLLQIQSAVTAWQGT